MKKRIVISGAPGTGKTSVIDKLLLDGSICHPEMSRDIISAQLAINGNITPWQDLNKFTELVIQKRTEQFHSANSHLEYYDRSVIDSFAYLLKDNLKIKAQWNSLAKNNRYYKKVFIAPPWKKIYKKDTERQEDFETAKQIHSFLLRAYEMFEYQVIILPKTNVHARIEFIKNQIEY
tara:strand:- start:13932 stop:14462 length:531 start_codon:yes stop_codon:yes gene_type:complete